MARETEDKKQLLIGRILVRAEKLAFEYRLTHKDKRDWLRDNGYRDRICKILRKHTLPELNVANWPDDKICEIIELATPEIAASSATPEINEPQYSSSQKSKDFVFSPPSSVGHISMPEFESPIDDFLTKNAEREGIGLRLRLTY